MLDAQVTVRDDGRLIVRCPHCTSDVIQVEGYFRQGVKLYRCPKCMQRYEVDRGGEVERAVGR